MINYEFSNIIYSISFIVDDGSENIECIIFKKDINEMEISDKIQFQLFDTVSIKGKICDYRNQRKIHITSIRKEYDINAEVFFWLEVMNQRKEIEKKYIITEETKKDVNEFYKNKKLNARNKSLYEHTELFKKLDNSKRLKLNNKLKTVDESILKYKIVDYFIKKKLYTFQFSKIKEEFKDIAIKILKQKENNIASEERISLLFSKIFHQLVVEGKIFKYDTVNDTYALIHYKYNLGYIIYVIIDKKCKVNEDCKYISYQDIVKQISKSNSRFKFAPEKLIKRSLKYLVENQYLTVIKNENGEELYSLVEGKKFVLDDKKESKDENKNEKYIKVVNIIILQN
ncbi:hypothetical protein PIROE2DRAFT_9071 [Piromyces sp. E2]|nr:hypothetical protein PIROE2DRAFT_9071 [Piromyces sp. E2]|eukprot:OUM64229.1 hypothetical protein PIROE2DRAFT_9071 [Piromyces sp. E2]